MVARGDIFWAQLDPPSGRRPVCVLTRDAAIDVLGAVVCAPLTRTIRGIGTEVEVGVAEGLPERCAITCDNVLTVRKDRLDDMPVGRIGIEKRMLLDAALRYALDIRY